MPPRKRPPANSKFQGRKPADPGTYLEPFLNYLEAECGMALNTMSAYRSDIVQFMEWYRKQEPMPLSEVDLKFLSGYLGHLNKRKLAATTVARQLASIKLFFRYLVLEGILAESVADLLNSPKLWKYLPKVLSPEKVNELLMAPCREDRYPLRDRAILAMMYATGCRVTEVVSLPLNAVKLEEGYAKCLGKGNKERMVSLNPVAVAAVEAYLKHERPGMVKRNLAEQALFLNRGGKQLSRIMVWNIVKKNAARVGCSKEVSPHTLRHSFATHMMAGGAEIRALQELLGHANIRTTQIYTHVDHSRLKAVHQMYHPRG
ncbi:site-specific tyrosine recombinase XerD [uncultured Gimesia sp.]|jgi:integrase/recombinase XerD|uniref:site-specific tyrosine recombinase XerD n=1 Tax=uncultured Gimesia sp. TaxID=1678688 RepID=UPI00262790E1|nr:site-specific tyrosine recombinase XerD [uncultured Gimesia sp.]